LPHYRIFHQAGAATINDLKLSAQTLLADSPLQEHYYIVDSVPAATVSLLLDAATLVVSRAGSTTLFEIAEHGRPAILIPIPEEVSHDQRSNAYAYARTGAASVIEEKNLTPHLLTEEIHSIISSPERWQSMAQAAQAFSVPDAAEKVANLLIQIGQEHGS
jgi:UDP-N-acetylglucosamine--N-acetylmuramyl-(pentapeptide) pyrophosphoryl-undecaprenol N-acetylglucosamine transferase